MKKELKNSIRNLQKNKDFVGADDPVRPMEQLCENGAMCRPCKRTVFLHGLLANLKRRRCIPAVFAGIFGRLRHFLYGLFA